MRDFEERNAFFDKLCNTQGLMWLGQNTNHFSAHPSVRAALIEAFDGGEYHAYAPPIGYEELRELIAKDVGLDDACVMVTGGAVEALYNVCDNIFQPGDELITTDPTWKWPMDFASKKGAKVIQLPIYGAERGYKLTAKQLREAVTDKTKAIYLVDPNNPLGTCHTQDEIKEFADIARAANAYFIHDATYFHFADDFTPAYRFYPEKTILTYSFSKWLGLAGLRLGAIIANRDIIEVMAAAPPNNLGCSVLAQRAAIAGLKSKAEWFPEVNRRQRRNQKEVFDAVAGIEGLTVPVYPSQANLLIIETKAAGIHPDSLVAAYQTEGIMIRQGRYHTKAFGDEFVKVSLTVPEKWADAFCSRLPDMVEKARNSAPPQNLF